MNKGFERFKTRLRTGALIKSLLFGLSCGAAAVAVYMAIVKSQTYAPELVLCLAIGGGTLVITALIAFLILFPSEKRIAKKLDRDLELGEKVQTMLAFRGQESAMLSMQREDTEHRLREASVREVRYPHAWRNLIAPVVAGCLMTVAVMMPIAAVETPPAVEEPDFEMTAWQETALLDLIEEVKASGMENIPKGATVAVLESLVEDLRIAGLKDSEMKQTVIGAIVAVNRIVNAANTGDELQTALESGDIRMVTELANAIGLISGVQAKQAISEGREALRVDEVAQPVNTLTQALSAALSTAKEQVAETDAAYAALKAFENDLRGLEEKLPDYTRGWAQDQLDDIFKALTTDLTKALLQQHTNRKVGDTVITTLMTVFEITEDEIPSEENPQQRPGQEGDKSESDDDELKDSQGGIGGGELLFGSDDVIFDHEANAQVKYGEVLLDYYKTVSEKTLNGNPSPELEQFISDYFKTLFDGSNKESSES